MFMPLPGFLHLDILAAECANRRCEAERQQEARGRRFIAGLLRDDRSAEAYQDRVRGVHARFDAVLARRGLRA